MMARISELVGDASIKALKDYLSTKYSKDNLAKKYANGLADQLKKTFGSNVVSEKGTAVNIAYRIINGDGDNDINKFYDLKPYFQRSSKAKMTKNGGWYLRVPVGGYHKVEQMRQAYGRKMWDQISHVQFGQTGGQQANIDRFRRILANTGQETSFAYQWKSTSVTREQWGKSGTRGRNLTFRTVSDKSDPNSWIYHSAILSNSIQENTVSSAQAKAVADVIKLAIKKNVQEYNSKL